MKGQRELRTNSRKLEGSNRHIKEEGLYKKVASK